jgi:hypothetical protein
VFCTGMGFMLLRRDELEVCRSVYPLPTPWFDYAHRNSRAVSEDVVFCDRYAHLGFAVTVDTTIVVGHRKVRTIAPSGMLVDADG